MSNSAEIVTDIFREAGTAFTSLSELTAMLAPMGQSQPGVKWTKEEIELLRECICRFALDVNKISHRIKNRTVSQIRATLRKKAFEEAGIPLPTSNPPTPQQAETPTAEQVTLNMLNASEGEIDVEGGIGSDVKREFDDDNDDVAT